MHGLRTASCDMASPVSGRQTPRTAVESPRSDRTEVLPGSGWQTPRNAATWPAPGWQTPRCGLSPAATPKAECIGRLFDIQFDQSGGVPGDGSLVPRSRVPSPVRSVETPTAPVDPDPWRGWTVQALTNGRLFYSHVDSGRTQWPPPFELRDVLGEWQEAKDASGNEYWFNELLQVSSWKDPRSIADIFQAVVEANVFFLQLYAFAQGSFNAVGEDGRTALHVAGASGSAYMAALLLQGKATVDLSDKEGCTALHLACRHGRSSVVRLLLEAGADPDAPSWSGDTPLHEVAMCGTVEALHWLVKSRANPLHTNGTMRTATEVAALVGALDVERVLRDYEAHPRWQGKWRWRNRHPADTDSSDEDIDWRTGAAYKNTEYEVNGTSGKRFGRRSRSTTSTRRNRAPSMSNFSEGLPAPQSDLGAPSVYDEATQPMGHAGLALEAVHPDTGSSWRCALSPRGETPSLSLSSAAPPASSAPRSPRVEHPGFSLVPVCGVGSQPGSLQTGFLLSRSPKASAIRAVSPRAVAGGPPEDPELAWRRAMRLVRAARPLLRGAQWLATALLGNPAQDDGSMRRSGQHSGRWTIGSKSSSQATGRNQHKRQHASHSQSWAVRGRSRDDPGFSCDADGVTRP